MFLKPISLQDSFVFFSYKKTVLHKAHANRKGKKAENITTAINVTGPKYVYMQRVEWFFRRFEIP